MSNTEVRRVALKADLATVAGLSVLDEDHEIGERVTPCCELRGQGIGIGTTDVEETTTAGTCATRQVEQELRLTVKNAAAPWTIMGNLIDDVCNALERPAGLLRAAAGVNWVLCSYDAADRSKGAADGIAEAAITVRFSYEYEQGSM